MENRKLLRRLPLWATMAQPGGQARIGAMTVEQEELKLRIAQLRQQHRDLDSAIESLAEGPAPDQLQLRRLKKQKLTLKDRISALEDQLLPDIIA